MNLSNRVSRLGTETAFEVLAEIEQLRAQGRNVIALSIGEPACATADFIKEAAKNALEAENITVQAFKAPISLIRAFDALEYQKDLLQEKLHDFVSEGEHKVSGFPCIFPGRETASAVTFKC